MKRARRRDGGFTLIETMVVLVLIGLLASTVGVGIYHRYLEGQERTARIRVGMVAGAVQQFMVAQSRCPTLEELVEAHYLAQPPTDPWGHAMLVRCPGEHDREGVDVLALGRDGREGTGDDIASWQPATGH
jgi:general secretion pathway protein G